MGFYTVRGSYAYTQQDNAIQALLDDIRANVPLHEALRGNVRTNPHRARVKELFDSFGMPEQYRTSFWIALAEGRPWNRRLWESV